MNPFIIAVAAVGGITGILATLYLVVSLPVVIVWKLYRRVARKIPITK